MMINPNKQNKKKGAAPLRALVAAALLCSAFAPSSHALGGPPSKIAGDSRPDPVWTPRSGIGVDLNPDGTAKPGQTGRVTAPQNQTTIPAVPAQVVVAQGETISVGVEAATDYDHWETPWQAGTGPNPKTYNNDFGDAADTVTYAWTGAGNFVNANSSATTWTAPATLGNYTLSCTIDDSNEAGRNDPAITRTVAVRVVPPKKWTVGSAVGTNLVNGAPVAEISAWALN